MVEIYRTDQQVLNTLTDIQDGCWINMVDPTSKELEQIAERFEIEPEDISSALDEEESSRISLEDGYTVILVDIPTPEVRHEKKMYTTIPLGIILKSEAIITVCKVDTPIINYFVRNKVKEFSTKKKMRFIYQMLFRSAFVYQANLRLIDKKRIEIEERVDGDTSDTDLIELHELESTLVYFATSLRANSIVLESHKSVLSYYQPFMHRQFHRNNFFYHNTLPVIYLFIIIPKNNRAWRLLNNNM